MSSLHPLDISGDRLSAHLFGNVNNFDQQGAVTTQVQSTRGGSHTELMQPQLELEQSEDGTSRHYRSVLEQRLNPRCTGLGKVVRQQRGCVEQVDGRNAPSTKITL